MKKQTLFEIIGGVVVLVAVLLYAITRYFAAYELNQRATLSTLSEKIDSQSEQLSQAQQALKLLVEDNKSVQAELQEQATKRLADQQALTQLSKDVAAGASPNLSAIISAWRPRIAIVSCTIRLPNNATTNTRGSGVLLMAEPTYTIFTNRHVVSYLGYTADQCTIQFPNNLGVTISYSYLITVSPTSADWATIKITPPAQLASLNLGDGKRCTQKATVGEPIVILGYPSIGSRDDVTATEGIVSGYEDDYYISSAKVERGNSGGAAILLKQSCYLGTPTYVDVGQLETLARILDQSAF